MQGCIEIDLSKVKKNSDGSVIVGEENAQVCINGQMIFDMLVKGGVDNAE